jgi:hypothetical protein
VSLPTRNRTCRLGADRLCLPEPTSVSPPEPTSAAPARPLPPRRVVSLRFTGLLARFGIGWFGAPSGFAPPASFSGAALPEPARFATFFAATFRFRASASDLAPPAWIAARPRLFRRPPSRDALRQPFRLRLCLLRCNLSPRSREFFSRCVAASISSAKPSALNPGSPVPSPWERGNR